MISAQENLDLLQKELTFKVRDIQSSLINDTYEVVPKLVLKADEKILMLKEWKVYLKTII